VQQSDDLFSLFSAIFFTINAVGLVLRNTLEKERYRSVCEELELSFSEKIIPFYLPEDLERGYIKAENKHGETKRYPIIELASERIY